MKTFPDGSSSLRKTLSQFPSEIDYISIRYEGGGRAGEVTGVTLRDEKGVEVKFNWEEVVWDILGEVLEHHHPRWMRDDGSQGHIEFFLSEGKWTMEHTEFYTTSEITSDEGTF